ncbi:Ran-binding protein [Entamoeba marina]
MENAFSDQQTFETYCIQYFTQPSHTHPFHQLLNNPLPPQLVDRIIQFIPSTNIYTTQFISQLLYRHISKRILLVPVSQLMQQIAPYSIIPNSLYATVYSSLLIRSWEEVPTNIEANIAALCDICKSNDDTTKKQGVLILLTRIINEVVENKQLEGFQFRSFKEKCLLLIAQTAIDILQKYPPTSHSNQLLISSALTVFSTVLEFPFTKKYDEYDTILQVPTSFQTTLASPLLQQTILNLFVAGNHFTIFNSICYYFVKYSTDFSNFLSKVGIILCQNAIDEESVHSATLFLDSLLSARNVDPLPQLPVTLELLQRICNEPITYEASLFYILRVFCIWTMRITECGSNVRYVKSAIEQATSIILCNITTTPELCDSDELFETLDSFGEIGRLSYSKTVEELTILSNNKIEEIQKLCVCGGSSALSMHCKQLALILDFIVILLDHMVQSRTDQLDEQLDVILLKLGIQLFDKEQMLLKSIKNVSDLIPLHHGYIEFCDVVRKVFMNDSISRHCNNLVCETFNIESPHHLSLFLVEQLLSIVNSLSFIEGITREALDSIASLTRSKIVCDILVTSGFYKQITQPTYLALIQNYKKRTKRLYFQILCNMTTSLPPAPAITILNNLKTSLSLTPNDSESLLMLLHTFLLSIDTENSQYLSLFLTFFSTTRLQSLISFVVDFADIHPFRLHFSLQSPEVLIVHHNLCSILYKALPIVNNMEEDEKMAQLEKCIRAMNNFLRCDFIPYGTLELYGDTTHHDTITTLLRIGLQGENVGHYSCGELFNVLDVTLPFILDALKDDEECILNIISEVMSFVVNSATLYNVRLLSQSVNYSEILLQYNNIVSDIISIILDSIIRETFSLYFQSTALLPCMQLFPQIYTAARNKIILQYSQPTILEGAFNELELQLPHKYDSEAVDDFFYACQQFSTRVKSLRV